MAALLFGLVVLSSLLISGMLYLDFIAASPIFLLLVGGFHIVVAIIFYRGYRHYHAVHRLVTAGRGELFLLAITNLIHSTRIPALRDHYRLRKCQGLVLTGQPLEALVAAEEYHREVKRPGSDALAIMAAEVEANLQLGQLDWSRQALERSEEHQGSEKSFLLQAVAARLTSFSGAHDEAARALSNLLKVQHFPWTRSIRCRNLFWYGQALRELGRQSEATEALSKAHRQAPNSHYGQLAARPW